MSTAVMTTSEAPGAFDAEVFVEDRFYEVVDGRRLEIPPMSANAGKMASRLCLELGLAVRAANLGEVVVEVLFRIPLEEDRGRKRQPDLAFVSFERWPADKPTPPSDNAWDVVPDLVVEVISPTDRFEKVIDKVREYFRGGVRLVWVLLPIQRIALIFDDATTVRMVAESGELDGGMVIPGFTLPLAKLLDPPQPTTAAAD